MTATVAIVEPSHHLGDCSASATSGHWLCASVTRLLVRAGCFVDAIAAGLLQLYQLKKLKEKLVSRPPQSQFGQV